MARRSKAAIALEHIEHMAGRLEVQAGELRGKSTGGDFAADLLQANANGMRSAADILADVCGVRRPS